MDKALHPQEQLASFSERFSRKISSRHPGVAKLVLFGMLSASCNAAGVDYAFTTLQVPGGGDTQATAINESAQIVGYYYSGQTNNGFLYSAGSFTTLAVPETLCGLVCSTFPSGINNCGQIVGSYLNTLDTPIQGFFYAGGRFTTINVPGSSGTRAVGINDRGQIVGAYGSNGGTSIHGFLDTAGTFTDVDVPGSFYTYALGINNHGQIVGYYSNSFDGQNYGFLDTAGYFSTIDAPGGDTIASGINNSGQIVGCTNNCGSGGNIFLYAAGHFTTVDVLGAKVVSAYDTVGINNLGQIVGRYQDNSGVFHGFLATPTTVPEPVTLPLFGASLVGLAIVVRRKTSVA